MEPNDILYGLGAIFVLAILIRIFGPSKGKVGERKVANKLDWLPRNKYMVINDVILPTPHGTSQIDHIVVSIYGIFVIETKYYNGWIYGGENSEYWTQNVYGEKHQFYNPIFQNEGHVKALRRVLAEFEPLDIIPIVAFSGTADIKMDIKESHVVYWSQLRRCIRRYNKERHTWKEVKAICDRIYEVKLKPSRRTQRRHMTGVRSAQIHRERAIKEGSCPRCGGILVERDGKYGRFYGCSNYPRCRFILK